MAAYSPSLQQNLGFLNTLHLIKPDSPEDPVQVCWQEIVTEWFPGREGYKWSFKRPTLANNNTSSITVTQVNALSSNPTSDDWAERQILWIECKRPSMDTPVNWENPVRGQLKDDLSRTLNASERIFGALAIGKKVVFYQFDGKSPDGEEKLVPLHPGTIDMDDPDGIAQVETELDYIKVNGLPYKLTVGDISQVKPS